MNKIISKCVQTYHGKFINHKRTYIKPKVESNKPLFIFKETAVLTKEDFKANRKNYKPKTSKRKLRRLRGKS